VGARARGCGTGRVTWLAGAVDERVAGVAPIVIEILDMTPNLNFEWQARGARTPVHSQRSLTSVLHECRCMAGGPLPLLTMSR
jgi:PhoPQ-activated pathogenicity-related protein